MLINTDNCANRRHNPPGFGLVEEALAGRPIRKVFCQNLSKLTEKRGTQARLAKHCKVNRSTVKGWVDGTSEPSFEDQDKIAEFFDTTVDRLYRDYVDPKSSDMDIQDALRLLGEALKIQEK